MSKSKLETIFRDKAVERARTRSIGVSTRVGARTIGRVQNQLRGVYAYHPELYNLGMTNADNFGHFGKGALLYGRCLYVQKACSEYFTMEKILQALPYY